MTKKLWEAKLSTILNSNLYRYEQYISKKFDIKFNKKYKKILNWSIENSEEFWSSIWDFCKVKGIKSKKKINKSKVFYKNIFLPRSKLNFAENLLVKNDISKAITFISENGFREERSWKNLKKNVNKLNNFFQKIKLKKKDRVAAYMPNSIETVESFIATSSIGAIWSSCSPDFGVNGVIERFSQIKPKILFIADKYFYNGKEINIAERIPEILKKIKSIKYLVLVNYPGEKYIKKKYTFNNVRLFFWQDIKKFDI